MPAGPGITHPGRSGGDGAPPAGNKTGCKELADGERYPSQDGSAARSAARHCEDTAMERRGAQAFSDRKEGSAPQGASFGRFAALHSLGMC